LNTNPYYRFLAGRSPATLIAEFSGKLIQIVSQLGEEGRERSLAPGKWTVRQILCHLADTEIAFAFRWRQALAEEQHVVQPFDQDLWAFRYISLSAEDALRTFVALRRWNVLLLDSLSPADWERELTHPERGRQVFRTLVETMAGHDLNHLGQLEEIAAVSKKS
jgi:uncharacterized damage-inducible protein DinB